MALLDFPTALVGLANRGEVFCGFLQNKKVCKIHKIHKINEFSLRAKSSILFKKSNGEYEIYDFAQCKNAWPYTKIRDFTKV